MARRRLPRAFRSAVDSYILPPSEIVYDQDLERPRFGNGVKQGGSLGGYTDDFAENFDDYVSEAHATDAAAVFDGLSEAIYRSGERTRRISIPSARIYAQPEAEIVLNNVEINAPRLTRPPYSNGINASVMFNQIDESRPIFRIGKNVTLSGLSMQTPSLTNANAAAVIAAAGAVSLAEKKAAIEARWGETAPLLLGQLPDQGGNMEFCTIEDITVPVCWDFIRLGASAQYQAAGAFHFIRPRVFSVHRDFLGYSSAESHWVTNGFFSHGVSPDLWTGEVSPLRDYCAENGGFFDCLAGDAFYKSFDGFNVRDTLIFNKKFGIRASSGKLDVTSWRGVHIDAVSHGVYVEPAGRIVNTTVEFDSYSYRFPNSYDDPDYATRGVIYFGATVEASDGPSMLSVRLNSDYSSGPAVIVAGDQTVHLELPDMLATYFGAESGVSTLAAVEVGNPNAIVRADGMRIKAIDGQTVHSGISVSAGRFEAVGAKFEQCRHSLTLTGGTAILDCPTSTGTVIADIAQSGGTLDVRNPRWSNPADLRGNVAFRAAGVAQTFNSGVPVVKTFGAEIHDQHRDFAGNAFIAPFTGQYSFSFALTHDASGTGGDRWLLQIARNGVAASAVSYKMVGDINTITATADLSLMAGDVIDLRVLRASGAGVFNVVADSALSWLSGRQIQ